MRLELRVGQPIRPIHNTIDVLQREPAHLQLPSLLLDRRGVEINTTNGHANGHDESSTQQ
jgi:hypothetical protein